MLDIDRLATADLERALPLLVDVTDLVHGAAAATAHRHPRRSTPPGQIPAGARWCWRWPPMWSTASAAAAGRRHRGDQLRRGGRPAADAALHRALVNLVVAKVTAAEGLDTALLDRAERLEAGLPAARLHDTADLHRGLWSRYVEDLDTARAALQRCIARARDVGDDFALSTFLCYLAATEELAGDYAGRRGRAGGGRRDRRLVRLAAVTLASGTALRAADRGRGPGRRAPPRRRASARRREPPDVTARFMGACVRGKVSAWRGDAAAAVRHLELAAPVRGAAATGPTRECAAGWITCWPRPTSRSGGRMTRGGSRPGCGSSASGWAVRR